MTRTTFWSYAPILIASISCLMLSSCMSANVTMYPVEGPLSKQTPLPVAKAKAIGVENNSGPITATLPDAQTCKGTWSSVAPRVGYVSYGNLYSTYGGSVYGTMTTSGPLPGVNRGEAFMTCSGGTNVQAEFYTGSGTASGHGIAKDNRGNVYKMLF